MREESIQRRNFIKNKDSTTNYMLYFSSSCWIYLFIPRRMWFPIFSVFFKQQTVTRKIARSHRMSCSEFIDKRAFSIFFYSAQPLHSRKSGKLFLCALLRLQRAEKFTDCKYYASYMYSWNRIQRASDRNTTSFPGLLKNNYGSHAGRFSPKKRMLMEWSKRQN